MSYTKEDMMTKVALKNIDNLFLEKYGRTLNRIALIDLAQIFAKASRLKPLNRDQKRTKNKLVLYLNQYLESFSRFLDCTAYIDIKGKIGGPRANIISFK